MKKKVNNATLPEKKPKKNALSKILLLILITAALLFVHQLSIKFTFLYPVVISIFYITLGLAIMAVFVLNRGFSSKLTSPDELPDEWTHIEKSEYLDKEKKRHAISKKLMFVILPLIIVIFIDLIDLYYLDILKNFISSFSGGNS